MSNTPMTDDQIATLLAAPLSNEARKIIYERALAFGDVPNFPKSDKVYTPEELAERDRLKRKADLIAVSGKRPDEWDCLEKALDGKFPNGPTLDDVLDELFKDAPEGENDPV